MELSPRSRLFCCFICGKKRTYPPGTTRGERKRRKIIAHALARARTAQIRGCHRDLPVLRLCAWFCQSGAEPKRAQSGSSTPVCPHARFPGKSPQFAFCAAGRRAAKCADWRACEEEKNIRCSRDSAAPMRRRLSLRGCIDSVRFRGIPADRKCSV